MSNIPVLELVSFVLFCFCCLVRIFSLLVGFPLILMHPMRKADRGGTALYWLGAAQLEAGSSCPMGHKDPSHRRKQSLAPRSTPTELWLITGNYCFPCCVDTKVKLECPLQGLGMGWGKGRRMLAWAG